MRMLGIAYIWHFLYDLGLSLEWNVTKLKRIEANLETANWHITERVNMPNFGNPKDEHDCFDSEKSGQVWVTLLKTSN